jgi:type III secretory pathway component EscU
MKFFLSILLLLTTAFYVLPVKEILTAGHDICTVDMDEDKEENNKKEKAKDLFSFSNVYIVIKDTYRFTHYFLSFSIPVLLHTVETPPPDLA